MKFKTGLLAFALATGLACAQGTLVFDQQSTGAIDGHASSFQAPVGQSFTPSFDSIGFIELHLLDGSSASTVAVNLRNDSIAGSLIGSTTPVTLPGSSSGTFDFFFSTPIILVPGTKYFFEPVVVGGGGFVTDVTFIQYAGGDLIQSGAARTDRDLWFREGIVSNVPEPSAVALCLAAGITFFSVGRKRLAT